MSDEQPYAREHGSETDDVIQRPDGSTMKRKDPSDDSSAEAPAQHPESGVAGEGLENVAGDPPADETAEAGDGADA